MPSTRRRGSHRQSRRLILGPLGAFAASALLAALLTAPATAQRTPAPRLSGRDAELSQAVVARRWLADPSTAPRERRDRVVHLRRALAARAGQAGRFGPASDAPVRADAVLFNRDGSGLPQNEPSVAVCRNGRVVLGGSNDYRGLVEPGANFTGWAVSFDGGRRVAKDGQLPALEVPGGVVPSGGDPVSATGRGCSLYTSGLNYGTTGTGENLRDVSAIGVYRSDRRALARCRGGTDPACWPSRCAVALAEPGHFLDKEWLAVGRSGRAGEVVWVTYTDFGTGTDDLFIKAVRCDADLVTCTDPIRISEGRGLVQFSYVTVGPDGRTYVTWSEIATNAENAVFTHRLRVAEPGDTAFGPTRTIAVERRAIPFGGKLNASEFRVVTILKSTVVSVRGRPRVVAVWDACGVRVLGYLCEDARVKLSWSDDRGRSWQRPRAISVEGQNYFPAIAADAAGRVAVAYYTSRHDPMFDNRQDVELVTLRGDGTVTRRQRLTPVSNESEADAVLGGLFIGDYISVAIDDGRAFVTYTANYRRERLLGEGRRIPQQDTFLTVRGL